MGRGIEGKDERGEEWKESQTWRGDGVEEQEGMSR